MLSRLLHESRSLSNHPRWWFIVHIVPMVLNQCNSKILFVIRNACTQKRPHGNVEVQWLRIGGSPVFTGFMVNRTELNWPIAPMQILQYRVRKELGPRFPTHHRPYRYHTHRLLNQHSNTPRIHKKHDFCYFSKIQKIIRKQLLVGNF